MYAGEIQVRDVRREQCGDCRGWGEYARRKIQPGEELSFQESGWVNPGSFEVERVKCETCDGDGWLYFAKPFRTKAAKPDRPPPPPPRPNPTPRPFHE